MKTRSIKLNEIKERWYVIDAYGIRLGKLAERAASLLMGKNNVEQVDYLTPKTNVVIINSKKVDIHPRKVIGKVYD